MKEKKVRRLAAIMFTDIVGYTALMEGDEEIAKKLGRGTARCSSNNMNYIKEK